MSINQPEPAVLYHMDAHLTETMPIGVLAEGLRVDNAFEGSITSGALAGATVRGVDYYLIRPDGVGVVDAREVIIPPEGGLGIAARARGFVHPPQGMPVPQLDALLDPAFPWPDLPFPIEVFQTFTAATPDHAYLNHVVVSHLGWVNYATRELQIDARLLRAGAPGLAAPGAR